MDDDDDEDRGKTVELAGLIIMIVCFGVADDDVVVFAVGAVFVVVKVSFEFVVVVSDSGR